MKSLNKELLHTSLKLLNERLEINNSAPIKIVVCGGSALIASNLISRTTKDVDIVALIDDNDHLVEPVPLPLELLKAAKQVANTLDLPENWINNGPSSGAGGIFQMGLPEGFAERLTKVHYGTKLTVFFIGRTDQIYFKLWAAVDQMGSYHADDLLNLSPTDNELLNASKWTMSLDISDGYRQMLIKFLIGVRHERVADKI